MENFSLIGSLAAQLHQEFVSMFYMLLPVFFALAIAIDWFRNPQGSTDFIDTLKRAVIATLLVAAFPEIAEALLGITTDLNITGTHGKMYFLWVTQILLLNLKV